MEKPVLAKPVTHLGFLLNNNFTQDCHILELRQCIHILDSNKPWESIKKSFRCMCDDEYQNKVLILDGLDEVCVLKNEFDGYEFIENLSNTLRTGFGRSSIAYICPF